MKKYISELDEGIENPTPVIVNRKHKRQETTHFKNYKTETKSTKKEEKQERDIMKIKIAKLSDKLHKNNK